MSTLKDIARIIADRYDMTQQDSEQFISTTFDVIKDQLTHDDIVKIKGLGTFKIQTVPERSSVDVNTGAKIVIDSHDRITFTPDNSMKDSVNKPFAHFETVQLNDGVVFDDLESDKTSTESAAPAEQTIETKPAATPEPAISNSPTIEANTAEHTVETAVANVSSQEAAAMPTTATHIVLDTKRPATDEPTVSASLVEDSSAEATSVNSMSTLHMPTADNAEDNSEEQTSADDDASADNSTFHLGTGTTILLALLLLITGFVIGRATADVSLQDLKEIVSPTPKADTTDTNANSHTDGIAAADTVKRLSTANKQAEAAAHKEGTAETTPTESKTTEPKTEEPKTPSSTKAEPKPKAETPAQQNYDADPRVRLGAYRITGVSQTITVKAGQTLESISKTYLGPGMECYVEAINGGIKDVSEGQKIKIPALQVKKRKKGNS